MTTLRKTYHFYRHDCCFPYAISFLLVLFIYTIDFYGSDQPLFWPSIASYLILAGYYVQNIRYYRKNVLTQDDPQFFILLLTVKIVLWGVLLLGLLVFSKSI
jgi:hypothetical protein